MKTNAMCTFIILILFILLFPSSDISVWVKCTYFPMGKYIHISLFVKIAIAEIFSFFILFIYSRINSNCRIALHSTRTANKPQTFIYIHTYVCNYVWAFWWVVIKLKFVWLFDVGNRAIYMYMRECVSGTRGNMQMSKLSYCHHSIQLQHGTNKKLSRIKIQQSGMQFSTINWFFHLKWS